MATVRAFGHSAKRSIHPEPLGQGGFDLWKATSLKSNTAFSRRLVLASGISALAAAMVGSSRAAGLGELSIILATSAGSTLDTVGRAFAATAGEVDPTLHVDVRNLDDSSGLLALR